MEAFLTLSIWAVKYTLVWYWKTLNMLNLFQFTAMVQLFLSVVRPQNIEFNVEFWLFKFVSDWIKVTSLIVAIFFGKGDLKPWIHYWLCRFHFCFWSCVFHVRINTHMCILNFLLLCLFNMFKETFLWV